MNKYERHKYILEIISVIILIYALLNLFGLPIPTKHGFIQPNFTYGLISFVVSGLLLLLTKIVYKEPELYYCKKCDKLLNEDEVKDGRCIYCKTRL